MRSSVFGDNYLFHLHTKATDGQARVTEFFAYASQHGVDHLIFLEHIRSWSTYDVCEFVQEVRRCSRFHDVKASVGFETKLLPAGRLDISDEHLCMAEIIGIAEHSFPKGDSDFVSAFTTSLRTYPARAPWVKWVWVHPGLWFRRRGLMPESIPQYHHMLREAQDRGVLIEHNLKYGLVAPELLPTIRREALVVGLDAHSLEDLRTRCVRPDRVLPHSKSHRAA